MPEGTVTSLSDVQEKKAPLSIVLRLSGRETSFNEVQEVKAASPMLVIPSGRETFFSDELLKKLYSRISVRADGIFTSERNSHNAKHPVPIEERESGNSSVMRLLHI